MRILWVSNSTWSNTGYGQQSALTIPKLEELGHQVACLDYYGYAGAKSEVNGRVHYPIAQSQWGDDMIPFAAKDWKADIVITLMDIWVLNEKLATEGNFRWLPWTPIDHQPCPPSVASRLKTAFKPIAMSQFGQQMMDEQSIEGYYIPHAVDTKTFYPDMENKTEYKKMLGFPEDCFLVGMVAANKGWPCRKAFTEAFEAFTRFSQKHPDAYLYVHTTSDTRWGGPDLIKLARIYDIDPLKIRFPYPLKLITGLDTAFMNKVYNSFDVFLNPAYGEGFGVPALEAQACGIPTVVTAFSAMPEVQGSGWLVKPERIWWTPLESFQVLPCVDDIVKGLNSSYQASSGPNGLPTSWNLKARQFAVNNYDIDVVAERYWKPFLEQVEGEINVSSQTLSKQILSSMSKTREPVPASA